MQYSCKLERRQGRGADVLQRDWSGCRGHDPGRIAGVRAGFGCCQHSQPLKRSEVAGCKAVLLQLLKRLQIASMPKRGYCAVL